MRTKWKPVPMTLWPDFWAAIGEWKRSEPLSPCPSCHTTRLSIYGHRLTVSGGTRGTIWVWCSGCYSWTHTSRIEVPESLVSLDPFRFISDREFQKIESKGLLDALD